MEKYYEQELEISTQKNLKFRFKNINTITMMTMIHDFQMSSAIAGAKFYQSYITALLENTEVCINEKWYPVKEGDHYYPAALTYDFRGFEEIFNKFYELVLSDVFQGSDELSTEQE